MTPEDKFRQWLKKDYIGKYNKSLEPGSADAYVNGIKSLSHQLGMGGNGLYDIDSFGELDNIRIRIRNLPDSTKDERSHFEAYCKFIDSTFWNR